MIDQTITHQVNDGISNGMISLDYYSQDQKLFNYLMAPKLIDHDPDMIKPFHKKAILLKVTQLNNRTLKFI